MSSDRTTPPLNALTGCLLGMAIGDALGLPSEGLSPQRQSKIFPHLDQYQFFGHYGMISDDTEHACMTAQALMRAPADPQAFGKALAWQLRWWFLALPAGVGLATLRACLKLWLGFPYTHSGVFSAGNGPAMRAAILGVALGQDLQQLKAYAKVSTEITHRDPKALTGALAIALAAHHASQGQRDQQAYLNDLHELCAEFPEFLTLMESTLAQADVDNLLKIIHCPKGITGYMWHTVPAVIWFWLKSEKSTEGFVKSLQSAIRCGGDTDTVAAILGAILGAALGSTNLPEYLLKGLWEAPRSVKWIQALAQSLELTLTGQRPRAQRLNPATLLTRNLIFLVIVLSHGFRRLLPPY